MINSKVYFLFMWIFIQFQLLSADVSSDGTVIPARETQKGTGLQATVLAKVSFRSNGSQVTFGDQELDEANPMLLAWLQNNTFNGSLQLSGSADSALVADTVRVDADDHTVSTHTADTKHTVDKGTDVKAGFSCNHCESPHCSSETICHHAIKCFKARYGSSRVGAKSSVSRGCISQDSHVRLLCSSASTTQHGETSAYVVECCEGTLCNEGAFPPLPSDVESYSWSGLVNGLVTTVMVVVGLVLMVAVVFVAVMVWRRLRNRSLKDCGGTAAFGGTETLPWQDPSAPPSDAILKALLQEDSFTSGSGAGQPVFIQRTLAKQICLVDIIGKGRYGEVWRGLWRGESVAVKIFCSRDELSWDRETEVYSTVLLRHDNVLGYYGSDVTSRASCTQLWLVTHYHSLGSLYDVLTRRMLCHADAMRLLLTAAAGLAHLHTEIFGAQAKPAIAHRDIKTKNILVKADGMCCIADFGLAVLHSQATNSINIGDNHRVGTKRYMSPELLTESLDVTQFDSFRAADMYSWGLVIWEVLMRVVSNGRADEYTPPYHGEVPHDPSFQEMTDVVVTRQCRPHVPARWAADPLVSGVAAVAQECWHRTPAVRLSALRVKKTLLRLALRNNAMPEDMTQTDTD